MRLGECILNCCIYVYTLELINHKICYIYLVVYRYRQQRKSVHKKYPFPGENTTRTRDTVDSDSDSEKVKCDEKAEEIEMESLQTETVPPQGTAEEEVDGYYFYDSTTVGNKGMGQ